MRIIFYPFFSQQDKRTGKFLLDSDSGVRHYVYMAERAVEAGWDVMIVTPAGWQCETDFIVADAVKIVKVPYDLAIDNLDRRLQWEPSWLRTLKCDVLLTQHEFLAYPLRCLMPEQCIVMECGLLPETAYKQTAAMFQLAWDAADMIHCTSAANAKRVGDKAVVWQFAYEDSIAELAANAVRPVDVLFNARASATQYSGHAAFISAMQSSQLEVRMTDPTGYIRANELAPASWILNNNAREEYLKLLSRSKVVVNLNMAGCSSYALQEAIAAGCTPVCYRTIDNLELLGPDWPYYCDGDLLDTVRRALADPLKANIDRSYSAAWEKAKEDISDLCDRRARQVR